jgi:hypothetical protein
MTNYSDPENKDNYKNPPVELGNAALSAAPNLSANNSESEEFLKTYMERLGREQKIAKVKNTGIIYLPVGSMKFTLMCLCVPFHGYEVWWLYKNFVCQKDRNGNMLSPMWRLNLPFLYMRKLLEAMRDEGKLYGLENELPIEKIILYWLILALCLVFPPPASILGTFSFAPFIFVNEYLIKLNKAANPDLKLNVNFTPSNYLVIIVGGAYFAINLYLNLFMHF